MKSQLPPPLPSTGTVSSQTLLRAEHIGTLPALVARLRAMAGRVLPRMYQPEHHLFAFTMRRRGRELIPDGTSVRYSAITLLGLEALEEEMPPFLTSERRVIANQLLSRGSSAGLGDAALIAWAAGAASPEADAVWQRMANLKPTGGVHATVDVAWSLAALVTRQPEGYDALTRDIAEHLMTFCNRRSWMFPHLLGGSGPRSHVTCFADQVYPIHALSLYAAARGDRRALEVAAAAAQEVCDRQGSAGQWWWHYDVRTGAVIEGYPVYAIHQDAMAPLALRALAAAGGPRLEAHVNRGLAWLASAPELKGGSLIDTEIEMVWRKVGRHEPGKTSRYIQAAATRLMGGQRVPFIDALFPPGAIDYEDRPYHWGWLLHAWADASDGCSREENAP